MTDNEPAHSQSDGRPARREFGRRPVLALFAVGGGAALLGAVTDNPVAGLLASLLGTGAPAGSLLAVRPDDGLLVTLSFTNLDVRTSLTQPPQLALHDATTDGLVTIGFTAQSIFEQTTFDNRPPGTLPPLPAPAQPVPALVSGPSRIVLRVPAGTAPFPYDLPTLLDLARFSPSVSPAADGAAPPGAPSATQTAIEAPFRLILSPGSTALFAAVRNPVTRNGRTELWHARAVPRRPDGTPSQVPGQLPVRAVWTPDLLPTNDLPPWANNRSTASLLPADRQGIVQKTTTEAPAKASLLLVSPMGASLDIDAHWTSDGLIGWRHQSYLGRDNYVRVEDAGYLFPFGFPAELITVTERIISDGEAFLRTQQFIVLRRSSVDYTQDPVVPNPQPFAGRNQPFTRVTTSTLVSPPLFAPINSGEFVTIADAGLAPVKLRYKLTLTTKDGRTVTSDLPLVYLSDTDALTTAAIAPFITAYQATSPELRTLSLGGQKVAYVPPALPADHSLPTTGILLSAAVAGFNRNQAGTVKEQAAFPILASADVHIEELDAIGGPQGVSTTLSYEDSIYLPHGFGGDPNSGEVWAKLTSTAPVQPAVVPTPDQALNFALSQATGGGMVAPQFAVDALSRVHGTITDLKSIAKNHFDPTAYFKNEAIKLLGAIPLNQVIDIDDPLNNLPPLPSTDENIPKIKTNRTGNTVETVITWNAKLKQFPEGDGNLFTFVPATTDPDRRLRLEVRFTASPDGVTSSVVRGELHNASLVFLDMIEQPIERFTFETHNGAKPAIELKLGLPKFLGDLRFLATLQDFLPALPGGVKIEHTPTGVSAGMTLAVPTVPLGVVLVQNLAVGVLFNLPFTGAPATLSFSFSTREHPFAVTVMALGGGGFLTIALSTAGGPPAIEGSLEFGAAVALDFGVASGSVSIMAGIYIAFGPKPDSQGQPGPSTVVITGYIRALGELSVLGLIHASVEFYLGLTFFKELDGKSEGKVQGEATLKIRVEVFLFSTTVSVTLRKEIGSGIDPSFGEQISAADWSSYCAAFA
jgi:hypothetical protein